MEIIILLIMAAVLGLITLLSKKTLSGIPKAIVLSMSFAIGFFLWSLIFVFFTMGLNALLIMSQYPVYITDVTMLLWLPTTITLIFAAATPLIQAAKIKVLRRKFSPVWDSLTATLLLQAGISAIVLPLIPGPLVSVSILFLGLLLCMINSEEIEKAKNEDHLSQPDASRLELTEENQTEEVDQNTAPDIRANLGNLTLR